MKLVEYCSRHYIIHTCKKYIEPCLWASLSRDGMKLRSAIGSQSVTIKLFFFVHCITYFEYNIKEKLRKYRDYVRLEPVSMLHILMLHNIQEMLHVIMLCSFCIDDDAL